MPVRRPRCRRAEQPHGGAENPGPDQGFGIGPSPGPGAGPLTKKGRCPPGGPAGAAGPGGASLLLLGDAAGAALQDAPTPPLLRPPPPRLVYRPVTVDKSLLLPGHRHTRQPASHAAIRTEALHELRRAQIQIADIAREACTRIEDMLLPTAQEPGACWEVKDSSWRHLHMDSSLCEEQQQWRQRKQQQQQQNGDTLLTVSSQSSVRSADKTPKDATHDNNEKPFSCQRQIQPGIGPRTLVKVGEALDEATKRLSIKVPVLNKSNSFNFMRSITSRVERDRKLSEGRLSRLARHHLFDSVIVGVGIINMIVVSLQIEAQASGAVAHPAFVLVERCCVAIYFIEFWVRVFGLRWLLLTREYCWWTMFDCVVVVTSLFHEIHNWPREGTTASQDDFVDTAASAGTVIKVLRVVRILRVFRWVRFLSKLRVMVNMIVHSLRALFWLFVLLFAVMYGFGVILTQGATEWRWKEQSDDGDDAKHREDAVRFFGSLLNTTYTLFISVTGGISWYEPADLAFRFGVHYHAIFVLYIFIIFFSVLNIVTACFVESAMEQGRCDHAMREVRATESRENYAKMLMELLLHADTDNDGQISLGEWVEAIQHQTVKELLDMLDVSETSTLELFDMLDLNEDRNVSLSELVDGLGRLKGVARSIDVHVLRRRVDSMRQSFALREGALRRSCRASLSSAGENRHMKFASAAFPAYDSDASQTSAASG